MVRAIRAAALFATFCAACSTADTDEPMQMQSLTYAHTFPAFDVDPGEDIQNVCQSWTLNNEEPVYVNAVHMITQSGWHHSNWVYVEDTAYEGPDGTWDCGDRDFSETEAAIGRNAGVFFAQSTQAVDETQQFPDGAVIVLPPHARIIGSVHLINISAEAKTTDLRFELATLPLQEVRQVLTPMSITFSSGLRLPARSQTVASMECDFGAASLPFLGAAPSFHFYYVLPHYHQRGVGMTIQAVGGPRDGEMIFETNLGIGDPLGQTLMADASGLQKLRISCAYDNPEDHDVYYSNSLSGEMCVFLAYTDSPLAYAGYTNEASLLADKDAQGRNQLVGDCTLIPFRYHTASESSSTP